MQIERLAAELLRALRGPRSQVQFSRWLGYQSNVAHTWEVGKRWPTASVTLRAARRVDVDVDGGLRRFYKVQPPFLDEIDPTSPEGVAAFLRDLKRDLPVVALARRCSASRFQVARWLSGESQPRLPDLLRLVEAMSQRLLDFVAVLVDPTRLPSARAPWERLEAARSLFWRMPHAQLVILALELADYRALPSHSDAWLADRLGLELWEVSGAIDRLEQTGQIRRVGARLEVAEIRTVDTRRHPEASTSLKRWWAQVALDRLEAEGTSWSYNVCAVSHADRETIVELYRATYRRVRAIVAGSSPAECLLLIQPVLAPLDLPSRGDRQNRTHKGDSGP